jgi:hypothetical protein
MKKLHVSQFPTCTRRTLWLILSLHFIELIFLRLNFIELMHVAIMHLKPQPFQLTATDSGVGAGVGAGVGWAVGAGVGARVGTGVGACSKSRSDKGSIFILLNHLAQMTKRMSFTDDQ